MFGIRTLLRKRIKGARGQSLVEFALVLPILLLLFMAIVDFGRVLFSYAQASSQLREALRMASVLGHGGGGTPPYLDCTGMRNVARRVFFTTSQTVVVKYHPSGSWNGSAFTTEYVCNSSGNVTDTQVANGDVLVIEVTDTIRMITPLFPQTLTFTLAGQRTIVKDIGLAGIPICKDGICSDDELVDGTCPQDCCLVNAKPEVVSVTYVEDNGMVTFTIVASDADDDDEDLTIRVSVDSGGFQEASLTGTAYTYEWEWDTNGFSGEIPILVQAVDDGGCRSAFFPVTVTVTGSGNNAPEVDIVSPLNGTEINDSENQAWIYFGASDPDGDTLTITVTANGDDLSVSSLGPGYYRAEWNPNGYSGNVDIVATASDGTDQGTDAIEVDVVTPVTTPPTISISDLNPGANVSVGSTLQITFEASDVETGHPLTVEVFYYVDGSSVKIGDAVYSGSGNDYLWSYTWPPGSEGEYWFSAKVTDGDGDTGWSTPAQVIVTNPTNPAPTVEITSPSDGATVVGQKIIEITAIDTEPLLVRFSYDGGTNWFNATHVSGSSYEYLWKTMGPPPLPNGTYDLCAWASDGFNPPVTDCGNVTVTVDNPVDQKPTIEFDAPLDGEVITTNLYTIRVTAQDAETPAAGLVVEITVNGNALVPPTNVPGTDVFRVSWDITSYAEGPYTIEACVTDNAVQTTCTTISVFISKLNSVHVGDLDATTEIRVTQNWDAIVTVTVHSSGHSPMQGVTVVFSWTHDDGGSGMLSCVTDVAGQCTVRVDNNHKSKVTQVVFQVTSLAKTGYTYLASSNHDPDGTSDGTTITVLNPNP